MNIITLDQQKRYPFTGDGQRMLINSGRNTVFVQRGMRKLVMILKRDGRKEPFMAEKIVVSAVKTGAPVEFAREIAGDISRNARDDLSTQEIRQQVLGRLRDRNPEWERNWQTYDAAVKKRATPTSPRATATSGM